MTHRQDGRRRSTLRLRSGQVFGYLGLWHDPQSGKTRKLWAFCMVLSHSRHMFVYVVTKLDQAAWIAAHVAAFTFFDGTPLLLVIDNLKPGVLRPDLYDPQCNRGYAELAAHYDVLIDPCRVGHPNRSSVWNPYNMGMAKREFRLSEAEDRALVTAFGDCKDGPTRTRYQAVRLYGKGYDTEKIETITGTCHSTLMEWCRKYRQGGIEALRDHREGGNRALLSDEQLEELRQRLHTYRPDQLLGATASGHGQFWTVGDLARAVERWYGVRYARHGSYVQLLKRCGFSYQRPTKVYKSRSEAQVQAFEEELSKKN